MKADGFRDFVLDQLMSGPRGVTCRAMLGGHGLYCGEDFFGIPHKGRLYLKTDDRSRTDFVRRGMTPFRPNPRQPLRTS